MPSKEPEKSDEEVKSTITDDNTEVNATARGTENGNNREDEEQNLLALIRRISEAAVGLNAVDQFASGNPLEAFIFTIVAAIIWHYGGN